jgi:hypothetical protein
LTELELAQFLDHFTESPVAARSPKDQPGPLKSTVFREFPQRMFLPVLSPPRVAHVNAPERALPHTGFGDTILGVATLMAMFELGHPGE